MDFFGQPFFFRLPDGRRDRRTWQGLFFTVIISLAIIFYASIQFINLIKYGDNTIMVSQKDSYFDSNFEFTTDNGLMVAFGLTAYDNN